MSSGNICNEVKQIKDIDYYPEVETTKFNQPWIKVIFNGVSLFLLGTHFDKINNYYFSSVMIFVLPMLFELLGSTPKQKKMKIIRKIHITFLLLTGGVSLLGILGILNIVQIQSVSHIMVSEDYAVAGGFTFPALIFLLLAAISFFLSCLYIFASSTKAEEKYLKL